MVETKSKVQFIFFVRHGETDDNKTEIFHDNDSEINELGK